ncbi:MAG: hypothetical protein R3231_06030, partial [bacterium]|nr:hypothetical protein [bacterium]
ANISAEEGLVKGFFGEMQKNKTTFDRGGGQAFLAPSQPVRSEAAIASHPIVKNKLYAFFSLLPLRQKRESGPGFTHPSGAARVQ